MNNNNNNNNPNGAAAPAADEALLRELIANLRALTRAQRGNNETNPNNNHNQVILSDAQLGVLLEAAMYDLDYAVSLYWDAVEAEQQRLDHLSLHANNNQQQQQEDSDSHAAAARRHRGGHCRLGQQQQQMMMRAATHRDPLPHQAFGPIQQQQQIQLMQHLFQRARYNDDDNDNSNSNNNGSDDRPVRRPRYNDDDDENGERAFDREGNDVGDDDVNIGDGQNQQQQQQQQQLEEGEHDDNAVEDGADLAAEDDLAAGGGEERGALRVRQPQPIVPAGAAGIVPIRPINAISDDEAVPSYRRRRHHRSQVNNVGSRQRVRQRIVNGSNNGDSLDDDNADNEASVSPGRDSLGRWDVVDATKPSSVLWPASMDHREGHPPGNNDDDDVAMEVEETEQLQAVRDDQEQQQQMHLGGDRNNGESIPAANIEANDRDDNDLQQQNNSNDIKSSHMHIAYIPEIWRNIGFYLSFDESTTSAPSSDKKKGNNNNRGNGNLGLSCCLGNEIGSEVTGILALVNALLVSNCSIQGKEVSCSIIRTRFADLSNADARFSFSSRLVDAISTLLWIAAMSRPNPNELCDVACWSETDGHAIPRIGESIETSKVNVRDLKAHVRSCLNSFLGPGGCALLLETIVRIHGVRRIAVMADAAGATLPLVSPSKGRQMSEVNVHLLSLLMTGRMASSWDDDIVWNKNVCDRLGVGVLNMENGREQKEVVPLSANALLRPKRSVWMIKCKEQYSGTVIT